MSVDESLAETFGFEPEKKTFPALIPAIEDLPENDDDYEFVKKTLQSLVMAGTSAFESLADIARNDEKIAAFQTMNDMLTNISDISMKILEIQKMKKEIEAKQETKQVNNTTNVAAFVGSTAELAKLLLNNNPVGEVIDVKPEETITKS